MRLHRCHGGQEMFDVVSSPYQAPMPTVDSPPRKCVFLGIGRFVLSIVLFVLLLPLVETLYYSCVWPGETFGPWLVFKLACLRFELMYLNPETFVVLLFAALLSTSIRTCLFSRSAKEKNSWRYLFVHILIVGLNPLTLYSLLKFLFPSLSAEIPHDADFEWLVRSFLLMQSRVLTAILIECCAVFLVWQFASSQTLVAEQEPDVA